LNRTEKEEVVKQLQEELGQSEAIFVSDYLGLNVDEITQLRRRIKGAGGSYRVVKNTLLRRAVQDTNASALGQFFIGPTAIATVHGDPVNLAKALVEFAKENEKLEIQVGVMGERVLTFAEIQELAKLPGKEVLLAKMLGSLNAPIVNFAGVMAAMLQQLVFVLRAVEEKKKEA